MTDGLHARWLTSGSGAGQQGCQAPHHGDAEGGDAGIVRHRGKIASTINNAQRALELIDEFGSIATFLDRFVPAPQPAPTGLGQIPAKTAESTAISKDLKRRGWSFVGPTTVYAFMQSMGLVNDHLAACEFR